MFSIYAFDPQWNTDKGSLWDSYHRNRTLTRAKNMSKREYSGGVVTVRSNGIVAAFFDGKELDLSEVDAKCSEAITRWKSNPSGARLWGLTSSGEWKIIDGKSRLSIFSSPDENDEECWFDQALVLARAKMVYSAYDTYRIQRPMDDNKFRWFNRGVEITEADAVRISNQSISVSHAGRIRSTVATRLQNVSSVLFGSTATPEESLDNAITYLREALIEIQHACAAAGGLATWAHANPSSTELKSASLDNQRLELQEQIEMLRDLIKRAVASSSSLTNEKLAR